MKEIRITLAPNTGMRRCPIEWEAFEVPDTDGTLAVHLTACNSWQRHPNRWGATHIASGASLPIPWTTEKDVAARYAKAFFDACRAANVDLQFADPFKGVPKSTVADLRMVFGRDLKRAAS